MARHAAAPFWVLTALIVLAQIVVLAPAVSAERLNHTVTLSPDDIDVSEAADNVTLSISKRHYSKLDDPSAPALPYRVVSFLLPEDQVVTSYDVVSGERILFLENTVVKPADPHIAEDGSEGKANPLAAAAAGVYPSQDIRYLGTGYLHGRGIASFAVFPVRMQGDDVWLATEMTVNVETGFAEEPIVVSKRERFREGFNDEVYASLRDLVVNPELNASYGKNEVQVPKQPGGFAPTAYPSLEGSPVDYLIITTAALESEYQRLADWKTAKGLPTVIRTVEFIEANTRNGVDLAETLRFFIQDAYAKWGISYLLLGGDTDIMPPRYGYSRFFKGGTAVPVDMYFSCLDGSWNDTHDELWGEGFNVVPYDNPDLYAELYQGRIPSTLLVDVQTVIDKIIEYEQPVVRDYMDRSLFLAEVLFPLDWVFPDPVSLNGADFAEVIINTAYVGLPVDIVRMYETDYLYPGSVFESKANAIDSLNIGFNHVNHTGHGFRFNMSVGDASILNGDADVLTNGSRAFNLYMLNCTAAAFDFSCLGEHYLHNPTGGAVSVIGANESAFPNASANYMNEYYELLFQGDVVHVGELFTRSRLPRTPNAIAGDGVDLWTHYIYTLLGDPEMPFYTAAVDTMDVFHVPSVGLGPQSILVNVSCGGSPVDSAVVCLSKGTDDYAVGSTNALGNVILEFTTESPGSISVVTTAFNKARRQTWIEVTPSGSAYVNIVESGLQIDDDQIGGTFGNGDGVVDAGETIDFAIQLTNTGGAASDSVWVIVRSTDGEATVLDSISAYGVIAAGNTLLALDPVRVQYDPNIIDMKAIHFDVEIHNTIPAAVSGIQTVAAGMWMDSFAKEVHAPDLQLIRLRIDDSGIGDGDGIISPNEQFLLYYEIKNYGSGAANNLSADIEDVDNKFTFFDSTDTYPDLVPIAQAENDNGFHISESDTTTENALRIAITDLHGRVYVDTFELRLPTPPDSLSFNTALGPDRMQVAWRHSTSPDVFRYNVYNSTTQGGPYTLATVDPVDHAVYLNTGLAALTKYYFVVTAIDFSGNESPISAEFSATTNVPISEGFPIPLATQTPSDPVAGDLDGDGDMEIVVGNNFVYAWHHDGQELIDGDGDPQTWGVINTRGDEYAAAVALGDVTGASPGLEIIAADLFTASVYCFDEKGDTIPGWPQLGEAEFRAPPCVGDLDGDGDQEILAVDASGVIYAWHGDGTEFRDGDSNPGTQGVFYRMPVTSFHYQPLALCDMDNDGRDEVIAASRTGLLYVLNGNGTDVPGFPFALPGEAAGGAVTGDVDDDGLPEIVVHVKTSELYLIETNGTVAPLWPRFLSVSEAPFFTPSPGLADFTNDGKLEIMAISQKANSFRAFLIDYQNNVLPGWPVTFSTQDQTECSPTAADVDGNGVMDYIIGDESKFIYAYDILGASVPGFPITTFDAVRATPFFGDIDGDGDLDMIVHSWDQNLYMYDLLAPYDPNLAQWPTIQANANRNGRHGYVIPTAIGNAAFSFQVRGESVNLMWLMSASELHSFNLDRAEVVDEEVHAFTRVAKGLAVDAGGFVHFDDDAVEMGHTYLYRLTSASDANDVFTSEQIYVPVSRAELGQNYPNPFNPRTRIQYWVPEGKQRPVQLVVYDVSGARVRTLINESKRGGQFEVTWDGFSDAGSRVASGVYFYRLTQPGFTSTRKMVLLK